MLPVRDRLKITQAQSAFQTRRVFQVRVDELLLVTETICAPCRGGCVAPGAEAMAEAKEASRGGARSHEGKKEEGGGDYDEDDLVLLTR